MSPRKRASLLDGYVVVDKPPAMTSHDVVGALRRQLSERRIGHAGTLDPDATGVLVVAVGRSTRLMRFVTGADKEYIGELVFGVTTSTLDAAGEVTGRYEMDGVTPEMVRVAASSFVGSIEQVPPMVSALKVRGRRLYELARQGEEVERAARPVFVERFSVEPLDPPLVYRFEVACSSGTYVRSLVADLGERLGGGAHLRLLRRTRVGPYGLSDSLLIGEIDKESLRPPIGLLGSMDRLVVEGTRRSEVLHGKVLDRAELGLVGEGPWALLDDDENLLAVYEPFGAALTKPTIVHAAVEFADEDRLVGPAE